MQQVQRCLLGQARTHQRGFCRGHRQHLQADLGDQTQRTPTAGQEAADIVASHVFHDLPAKREVLAQPINEACAQHIVAHSASGGAGRTAQTCGHHAAYGRTRAEVRRLKRQALAFFGKRCFQFGQRRSATGRDHQLAGLVAHDATVGTRIEHITRQALTPKVFTPAAAQAHSAPKGSGGANGIDEGSEFSIHAQHVNALALRPL